ncbi:unnamed protein product [Blepharisma stoltei]|uniref:Histidine kinase n=1 Tax=Blepharisma stoltei TaxID=1481888 RepID=A0AAU9JNN4_9CILI|nr:unnamed protein product [Blepharisma stoltei]
MENLQRLWWDEETIQNYHVLKKFNYWRLELSAIAIILFSAGYLIFDFECWGYVELCLKMGLVQLLIYISVVFFENRGPYIRTLFVVALSEYNCFIWWLLGQSQYKSAKLLLSNVALSYTNIFEWPFILSPWIRGFILFKHLIFWHYYSYYFEETEAQYMPHLISFLLIWLCDLSNRNSRKSSFERFLSRKKLESAEKRLSVIFNLFPDGILILSENKSILYVNAITSQFLECSQNNIIPTLSAIEYCQGKKYSHLSNSNRLIDDINLVKNLQLNQQVVLGLSQTESHNLEWRVQKVLWDDQEAALLTIRDANHIIKLEQSISDNKLKNILLRSVSHELRTPINAITSLSDALKTESEATGKESFKEKLDIISVSSKLLLSLVNDLLDYSKILAGAFSIQKRRCLLRSIIYDSVNLIKLQAEKKGLKLVTRIDPMLPAYVFTDPLRLSQILLNLLSNALKFTIKGNIEICCILSSKEKLKVIVYDTGIGIEESRLSNIFKEFNTQVSTTINPSGCGLGLFISSAIAKKLGSKSIEVISEVQKGSSFSFLVDIQEEALIDQLPIEEINSGIISEDLPLMQIKDFNRLIEKEYPRVLVADDNDFNRIAIGALLVHYGISCNEACTGKEAVESIQQNDRKKKPYKLVIMDGSMPELNGWEATKVIHQLFFDGKIDVLPIIIGYTAFSSEEELTLCTESGMKECLIKPCNPDVLISKVLHYLAT